MAVSLAIVVLSLVAEGRVVVVVVVVEGRGCLAEVESCS